MGYKFGQTSGVKMIEYLILNEESIIFNSIDDCKKHLPCFFEILIDAFKNNMKSIRVSDKFDKGWYNLEVAENFCLRDFINSHHSKDYKIRIKIIISKTELPQIPTNNIEVKDNASLSEFFLENNKGAKTPSLGFAFLLDQVAISFKSEIYWNKSKINLISKKMNDDGDIKEVKCIVKNVAQFLHWQKHFIQIEKERKASCIKGRTLWKDKNIEFENLIFCKIAEKQFKNLSINDAVYNKLWENLKKLDSAIIKSKSDTELKNETKLNFTDENDSVKNNPKLRRHREFHITEDKKVFFGLHVKNFPAYMRLHFYSDYENKKIYIGYFGKHLPI